MIRDFKTHAVAYGSLILALVIYVIAFLAAWPNHGSQRIIAIAIGSTYALWGIVTHVKTEHVTRRVIMEYIVVGLLASVLLILVTI